MAQASRRIALGVRDRSSWHDSIDARLYTDERERPVMVGLGYSGAAELARLRAGSTFGSVGGSGAARVRSTGCARRLTWLDLVPRWAALLVVFVAAVAVFQGAWWSGASATATVTYAYPTTASTFGSECSAGFAGQSAPTAIPCPDPMPAVGDRLSMRTLGWPLRGAVLPDDDLGRVVALAGGLALLLCLAVVGTAALTLRSCRMLTPVLAPLPGLGRLEADDLRALAGRLPLRQLAEAVAVREAHGQLPGEGSSSGRVRTGIDSVRRLRWRQQVVGLASCPTSSSWAGVSVRSAQGQVWLALFAADPWAPAEPGWLLPVAELLRPGTPTTVLGALEPAGLVAVHADGRWLEPLGGLEQVDASVLRRLRRELTANLAPEMAAATRPTGSRAAVPTVAV